MAIGDSFLRPRADPNGRKLDGTVPGMTWDQFVQNFNAPGSDLQGYAKAGNLGNVYAQRDALPQYGGEGSGPNAINSPNYSGAWNAYRQILPDGTQNEFSRGPGGELQSQNKTINTDTWWDSTGLPILASLGLGQERPM
jgi:hypothetical protein